MENKEKITLNVQGMTCSNCALGVTKYLENQGLKNVHVDFSSNEARFDPNEEVRLPGIITGIQELGYKVSLEKSAENESGISSIEKKFLFCAFFTLPLFSAMFLKLDFLHDPYVQLGLCIPVFVVGLWHFGRSAWHSLKARVPNMDVLIAIGSTAAFVYSFTGMIYEMGPAYLFYETTATIITLVLLGNVLEHRSVKQTTTAIRDLAKLQPDMAKLVKKDPASGEEKIIETPIKDIEINNVIRVNSGDKIPVDGKLIQGEGSVDESMLTGESIPVEKSAGADLIGGTILNEGNIQLRVTAAGSGTVLSQIINLVKEAQSQKPPIQRLADKISAYFVPIVLIIALLTFGLSFFAFDISAKAALLNSIAVLVISCPCAMGLATPTAVTVGIGRSAKAGILIKGGTTIETLAKIKTVVFDKTGTLTTGNFKIKNFNTITGGEKQAKEILLSLEQHSSHPIAKSIVKELEGENEIALEKIKENKGVGIKAIDTAGNTLEAGSFLIAEKLGVENTHNIYLLKNDELIATIDIEDELREEASGIVDELKKSGFKTVLLSGDRREKCEAVAKILGIEEVYSEHQPQEKLKRIEALNSEAPAAMIGDGINDAPALAKASIGISLSNATDVAINSANVILLNNNLSSLKPALLLGKHTLLTIKQNLFWAFFYNVLAIPVAAVGFLTPMIAALAMAFSDVVVIGNSLRLKVKKLV
jgi:Cu+-exporting ATPase